MLEEPASPGAAGLEKCQPCSEISDGDRAEGHRKGALCHCPPHQRASNLDVRDPEGAAQLGLCSQPAGPGLGSVFPTSPQSMPTLWVIRGQKEGPSGGWPGCSDRSPFWGPQAPGRQVLPHPDSKETGQPLLISFFQLTACGPQP